MIYDVKCDLCSKRPRFHRHAFFIFYWETINGDGGMNEGIIDHAEDDDSDLKESSVT